MKRVYLAGKVGHTDWRHGLFPLRHVELRYQGSTDRVVLAEEPMVKDGFEYVGPYFLSDDHGCFHGENQHGLIDPGYADGVCMADAEFPQHLNRQTVLNSCLHWLELADVVFAWIDDDTAYGTLVELGYAAALKKTIFVAFDQKRSDLWFAQRIAMRWVIAADAEDAWREFVHWFPRRHFWTVKP